MSRSLDAACGRDAPGRPDDLGPKRSADCAAGGEQWIDTIDLADRQPVARCDDGGELA